MSLVVSDQETIAGTARRLRRGEVRCVDLLQDCLDRIDERDSVIRAWVLVDRPGAIAQARARDEELRGGHDRGPLHGIPIGIKDIIDVRGLPTACGVTREGVSPAPADAPVVARLRAAGAVLVGKTVTTAYAWIDPPVTRNPWNQERTPGGSSSGSAAAVACRMCHAALGTQTGGSITRPASFCGVAGMKPTYGTVSTEGILPFAPSLDHPGPIARSVEDLRLIYSVIRDPGAAHGAEAEADHEGSIPPRVFRVGWLGDLLEAPAADRPAEAAGRRRQPGYFDRRAAAEARGAAIAFLQRLRAGGAEVVEVRDPVDFEEVRALHRTIMAYEAAATHRDDFALRPDWYPPRMTELIREGQGVSAAEYERARALRSERADCLERAMLGLDALATPAAFGPPPDRSTTGDPAFNSPWSYVGFPTVSLPIGFSADGLPLAVQWIGRPGGDFELLRLAQWCQSVTRAVHAAR